MKRTRATTILAIIILFVFPYAEAKQGTVDWQKKTEQLQKRLDVFRSSRSKIHRKAKRLITGTDGGGKISGVFSGTKEKTSLVSVSIQLSNSEITKTFYSENNILVAIEIQTQWFDPESVSAGSSGIKYLSKRQTCYYFFPNSVVIKEGNSLPKALPTKQGKEVQRDARQNHSKWASVLSSSTTEVDVSSLLKL